MQDQVVVVTGASSGVGRAIARAYGARKAKVALLARNQEALDACAAEIREAGGEARVYVVDVSDADAVDRAAASTVEGWGRIDTWVNVAMATVFAPVKDTTAAEFRRVTEVSYLGYVHGTLAALRHMLPRDSGTIVQVGSALAYRSIPLQSAYCGAKAAIRGFTDSLRCELIHDGSNVRLTHVHLPAVNTPQSERQRNKMPKQQQPVPPLYSPESIADAILWAADTAPREMLVGTPTVKAALGQKVIAGPLDSYLAHAAWEPQFVDEPNDQSGDILFETLPGDPGAHGEYRELERGADLQMRMRMNPVASTLIALGIGIGVGAAMLVRGASRSADDWSRSEESQTGSAAARP
ncbi:MAG: SDR family oxidoreductase [Acidobacteria bacterium]|nr:SDR family oxidoreductase [Acidobacteriota bacterium]